LLTGFLYSVDFLKRFIHGAVHLHDLRHTFALRCTPAKVDIHTLNELLGHYCVTVKERYLFSGEEQKRKGVNMLNQNEQNPFSFGENLNFRHGKTPREKCKINIFSQL
jgi:integrase